MDTQKDNNQKTTQNKALTSVSDNRLVNNYYGVFDHNTYVDLATCSQKIVTAVYMLTDFVDSQDPMRALVRENSTAIMRDLFSLVHLPKTDRVAILSSVVNKLFANLSYLNVIYSNGFISDMNYRVVSGEMEKLQSRVNKQITKSLPYDKKENNNQVVRDFTFSETFFETSEKEKSTPSLKLQSPIVKDTEVNRSENKKTSNQTPVFVPKKTITRESLKAKAPLLVKQKKVVKKNSPKEERKENILKILKQKRNASINDICALFKDCSSKTIQRDLSELIDAGLVNKEGSRRWSTYNLTY